MLPHTSWVVHLLSHSVMMKMSRERFLWQCLEQLWRKSRKHAAGLGLWKRVLTLKRHFKNPEMCYLSSFTHTWGHRDQWLAKPRPPTEPNQLSAILELMHFSISGALFCFPVYLRWSLRALRCCLPRSCSTGSLQPPVPWATGSPDTFPR